MVPTVSSATAPGIFHSLTLPMTPPFVPGRALREPDHRR
jgi:hypothetical protein